MEECKIKFRQNMQNFKKYADEKKLWTGSTGNTKWLDIYIFILEFNKIF